MILLFFEFRYMKKREGRPIAVLDGSIARMRQLSFRTIETVAMVFIEGDGISGAHHHIPGLGQRQLCQAKKDDK